MNRIIYVMIVFLLTMACQKGSGDNIPGAYSIQPDSLSPFSSIHSGSNGSISLCDENFSISFNGARTGKYAVIYLATIDGVQKVGMALSDNPNSETFNLKIYFTASAIPTSPKSIDDADLDIKVKVGSNVYTKQASSGVTISFADQGSGIYKITSSGTINTSGGSLDISGSYIINALNVSQ
jgi:hypothetical protein